MAVSALGSAERVSCPSPVVARDPAPREQVTQPLSWHLFAKTGDAKCLKAAGVAVEGCVATVLRGGTQADADDRLTEKG